MKILRYIFFLSALSILPSACTTGFEGYNDNPNVPGYWEISPVNLLEEAIFSGVDGMLYRTWLFNGELMQYTVSGTSNNAYHRYVINNAVMTSTWNSLFTWAATAEHMKQLARLEGKIDPNTEAMGLILKVLYLSNATDIFGDIPYRDAFKSKPYYDEENNYVTEIITKPVFDSQKEVYRQLFATLEEANRRFDIQSEIKTPAKDLIYGGDAAKWKKFNNSLYLRLLMRLSNRGDEKLTYSADGTVELTVFQKINEILNNSTVYPIFTSNQDNAALDFTGISPFENRFGRESVGTFNQRRAAEQIISMMSEQNDPRITSYFTQQGGTWNGLPSGATSQETVADNVAILNKNVLGSYTSPYGIMKYDEILFIKSEAAKRGIIPGGDVKAEEYYNEAITSSCKYWDSVNPASSGITDEHIINFIYNYAAYNGTLENILNQKYIAQFWVGYEAWHDYRRTGYPRLRIGSGTFNDHILPTRFQYPTAVATTNPDNYQDAVERLRSTYRGSDDMKTPVWWSLDASVIN